MNGDSGGLRIAAVTGAVQWHRDTNDGQQFRKVLNSNSNQCSCDYY